MADLKNVAQPKRAIRLALFGALVLVIYGLINPLIPKFLDFGFSLGGVPMSLGTLLAAGASAFIADLLLPDVSL